MRKYEVKPEIEAFDLSHIHQAVKMNREGRIPGTLYLQFVMGVKNAMPVDRDVFDYYVKTMAGAPAGTASQEHKKPSKICGSQDTVTKKTASRTARSYWTGLLKL